MSETHRAVIVLLILGLVAWRLARPLGSEQLPGAHGLRRGLWFALTIIAFALGDFWVFSMLALGLLIWARSRDVNLPALFLALLFVVPPSRLDIPGFGLINFFFSLSFPRLLSLVLLLPLFLRLVRQQRAPQRGLPRLADLLFMGYLAVELVLLAREDSVTSAARGAFYVFIDLFLPYYVFSRAFDNLAKIRDAMASLVIAGVVLSLVGLFEAARYWLLYASLVQSWGSPEQLLYLDRSGLLRGMGSTGHAIALGYLLAVCLLLYLPLRERMRPGWQANALLLLLCGGLFSALSRGPWVATAIGLLFYVALGPRPVRNVSLFAGGGAAAAVVASLLPGGGFIINLLPFVGTVETSNIDYRQKLVENSWKLIWENPVFGSTDYIERLAAMGMVQGQGIVDIVNTYLQIALQSGFVGLTFFAGVLLAALLSALAARKQAVRAKQEDAVALGRSLAAAQVTVMITIFSVSSIVVIPWVFWCLAGMLVGYARVVQASTRAERTAQPALRFA
ncbi:O-antigen ligase family protein [Ramlibacter sp. PS3R-8]|uniref:O-antigen ligase family protein n=1 Tax=Ramlibacter sp. PS3R-8 TaxID=3133437 RepID=UPI0030A38EC1